MGKPRMIILVRHAQSEGNKNREIHQMVPDHRVKLTSEGHKQAREAGLRLRALLRPDDSVHFFTSPYRRTRETTEGIVESLSSDSPSPSPFPRHAIQVYEEPRLREQDFGNFQPCSAEMERMWLERADYGHFFYRIPNGESAADAYDRVSGFNETLWRMFGDDDFASVCVLVTHGLMTRVFLMKWYHWSVEYFEDLRNINHCEFVIMRLNPDNGKYILDNQLRTWSDLRREKERDRQRERVARGLSPGPPPSEMTIPIRRKWGGCPDGCSHGIRRSGSRRTRHDVDAVKTPTELDGAHAQDNSQTDIRDIVAAEPGVGDIKPLENAHHSGQDKNHRLNHTTSNLRAYTSLDGTQSSPGISADNKPSPSPSPSRSSSKHDHNAAKPKHKRPDLSRLHRDSEDHLLHPPPDSTFLSLANRDDGGGGAVSSGANSVAVSEDEREGPRRKSPLRELQLEKPSQDAENDGDDEGSGTGQKPRRARLYRQRSCQLAQDVSKRSGENSDSGHDDDGRTVEDDIQARRRAEQSIQESIY